MRVKRVDKKGQLVYATLENRTASWCNKSPVFRSTYQGNPAYYSIESIPCWRGNVYKNWSSVRHLRDVRVPSSRTPERRE
jgi:hypothetical protein